MKAYLWTMLILWIMRIINSMKTNDGTGPHGFVIALQAGFIAWTVYLLSMAS